MIGKLSKAFAALFYPPLCLHCRSSLASIENIFCTPCLDLMHLIDPSERCPFCFSGDYDCNAYFCSECSKSPPVFDRMAAAFDYIGPAATLVRRLKYADQPYLSKGAGAFLAAQWIHLNWPPPDFLVPVPLSFMHWMERGYNQSRLLCESMSRILNVPIADVLRRKSGDYSQAALSRKQRVEFEHHTIELKKNPSLLGKTLLLVDDVMTTGTTLRKCGEVLLEGRPAKLYSLVLCRAMR